MVLIVGPRRAGKTTLVRKMENAGRTYITLDDQTVLAAAQSDPAGFIRGLDRAGPLSTRSSAPDLLLAIKKAVDDDYRPGRFLLTGSANVLTLPRVADIEKLAELPKFIRLLAEYSGRLVNYSQFGSSIDVSHKTGQRYVRYWSRSSSSRPCNPGTRTR